MRRAGVESINPLSELREDRLRVTEHVPNSQLPCQIVQLSGAKSPIFEGLAVARPLYKHGRRSRWQQNDTEVKRIIEAITEYRELVQQSSEMRDQLESLQKRWFSLRQEREQLRTSVDGIHMTLAQVKVDYQAVMKRMTDLYSTEDTVLDNMKFLIDELTSVLKKHEA